MEWEEVRQIERHRERNFGLPAYSKFVRHNRFLPTEKIYPHVRTRAAAVAAGGVHMCISQLLSVDFFRVFKCPLQPKPGPAPRGCCDRPGPVQLCPHSFTIWVDFLEEIYKFHGLVIFFWRGNDQNVFFKHGDFYKKNVGLRLTHKITKL